MAEDTVKEVAPETEKNVASSTTPSEENMMRCPCCGKNTLKAPLKVNTDLMDHYMSCVMTGVPFWHDYPLYGGRIVLRITMLDNERQRLLDKLSTGLELLADVVVQSEKLQANQLRVLTRNLLHLEQVKMQNGPGVKTWQVAETLTKKMRDIFSTAGTVKLSSEQFIQLHELCHDPEKVSGLSEQLISVAIDTHYRLSSILIATGIDENFWQGIELA